MSNLKNINTDVLVIGTGLAGLAATLFAANRGLSCVEVGQTGEINFSSGFLDLLGVHPVDEKHAWTDPWAGIDALVRDIPEHPYARLPRENIQSALEEVLTFLNQAGLPYMRRPNQNIDALTSFGNLKSTYCVPHTMWNGVEALEKKPAGLLIDIRGLKGFSARQIAAALKREWPDVRTARISFPDTDHLNEVYTEHMASALILPTKSGEISPNAATAYKRRPNSRTAGHFRSLPHPGGCVRSAEDDRGAGLRNSHHTAVCTRFAPERGF